MDISDQTTIFNKVTFQYFVNEGRPVGVGWASAINIKVDYKFGEILEVAKHHAECGENVYLIGFPRSYGIGERPNTLFFLDTFEEIIDVTANESALVIILGRFESSFAYYSAITHLHNNFKSCPVVILK